MTLGGSGSHRFLKRGAFPHDPRGLWPLAPKLIYRLGFAASPLPQGRFKVLGKESGNSQASCLEEEPFFKRVCLSQNLS